MLFKSSRNNMALPLVLQRLQQIQGPLQWCRSLNRTQLLLGSSDQGSDHRPCSGWPADKQTDKQRVQHISVLQCVLTASLKWVAAGFDWFSVFLNTFYSSLMKKKKLTNKAWLIMIINKQICIFVSNNTSKLIHNRLCFFSNSGTVIMQRLISIKKKKNPHWMFKQR